MNVCRDRNTTLKRTRYYASDFKRLKSQISCELIITKDVRIFVRKQCAFTCREQLLYIIASPIMHTAKCADCRIYPQTPTVIFAVDEPLADRGASRLLVVQWHDQIIVHKTRHDVVFAVDGVTLDDGTQRPTTADTAASPAASQAGHSGIHWHHSGWIQMHELHKTAIGITRR